MLPGSPYRIPITSAILKLQEKGMLHILKNRWWKEKSPLQCDVIIENNTVQYSTIQYSTIQYSKVHYSTVQYSTIQYSTVQYSTVQYSTIRVLCSGMQIIENKSQKFFQHEILNSSQVFGIWSNFPLRNRIVKKNNVEIMDISNKV